MSTDLVPATEPQGKIVGFDYSTVLDPEVREAAREAARKIKTCERHIGAELIAIKAKLDPGAFGPWLKAEFGMSVRTAQNRMEEARLIEANANFSYLPVAVVRAVATAPEAIRPVLESGVADGTLTTRKAVKAVQDAEQSKIDQATREAAREAREAREAAEEAQLSKAARAARAKRKAEKEAAEAERLAAQAEREKRMHGIASRLLEKIGRESAKEVMVYAESYDWVGILRALRKMLANVETVEPEPETDLDYDDQSAAAILARNAERIASQDLGEALGSMH